MSHLGDHADAAAPADPIRVRQHRPQLLGVDPSPANELPADEVTEGFNNNAGVLTVSSLHAEKYVLVSEALAKAAVANLATLTGCDAVAKGEDACAPISRSASGGARFGVRPPPRTSRS